MQTQQVTTLKLSQLMLSNTPMQQERRKYRTKEDVKSLADTIKNVGQLHAIIVRPNPHPDHIKGPLPLYEIVAGEGRYLATKEAGFAVSSEAGMSFDRHDEHDGTTEKHERRITRCRSCNAKIIFLPTAAGRQMPVDADTVEPSDETFDRTKHTSHFSSCPNASKHRKPR